MGKAARISFSRRKTEGNNLFAQDATCVHLNCSTFNYEEEKRREEKRREEKRREEKRREEKRREEKRREEKRRWFSHLTNLCKHPLLMIDIGLPLSHLCF
jgi:hypothetical protein